MTLVLLASCKGDEPKKKMVEQEGSTYMSVSLRFQGVLRAEEANYNSVGDWGGRDKIETVDIFVLAEGLNNVQHFTQTTTKATADFGTDGVYALKPWITTPGNKEVYAIINADKSIVDELTKATKDTFAAKYAAIQTLVGNKGVDDKYAKTISTSAKKEDVITMTGAPAVVSVANGVTEEQASKGANTAKVSVRRIASLVAVTLNKELHDKLSSGIDIKRKSNEAETTIAKIKKLTWTVAQYEKTAKLYEANTTVATVQSPGYNYVTNSAEGYNKGTDEAKNHYDYTLLKDEYQLISFARTGENKDKVASITASDMKFITETTHKLGTENESGYRRGNTPYVMITATIAPEGVVLADGETAYTEGKDLYYGTIDGKFYTNEAKAKEKNPVSEADKAKGKDGVITFKGGKMYYFAWLNPDKTNPKECLNSPVLRNNLYHVNVAGFSKLGFSGNPYNPGQGDDDPDPDDPTPDPNDPIKDKETYMTTEITVINWGTHSYDVTF